MPASPAGAGAGKTAEVPASPAPGAGMRVELRVNGVAREADCWGGRVAALRTASKIFSSRCSGRGSPTAPRGSRRRSARGAAPAGRPPRRRGPGVQKPHCTAPASTNASWTRCSRSPSARPSTVTTSCPSACAASTRHAHTSTPSSSTEHEPHSPCSHAFFDPGTSSFSRSAKSSDSPSQQSASRSTPLTRSAILTQRPLERALRHHAQRVPPVGRGAAHVVDRRRGRGDALGERVRLVARRGHEHRPRRRPSRTTRAARRPR